jgi:MFS family permease
LASGIAFFGLWSLLLGVTAGFVAGLPTTIIGDRVDSSLHGIAIAWLRTATDTGMMVGPLAMGARADTMDLTVPFVLAGIILCMLAFTCHRHALRTAS